MTKNLFIPKTQNAIKVYEQKNAIKKNVSLGEYYIPYDYFISHMRSFEVFAGDIIVSCAGTIGETFVMPPNLERGIINQALMRMNISKNIDVDYFLIYFDYILKGSSKLNSSGTAIKNIPPFSVFKKLSFALPPLSEQKRIVAKIEELLPFIEQYAKKEQELTALHQAFPEQLKKSILQAAIQGKLTEQNPNDEPAVELVKRIQAEKERLILEKKIKKPKQHSEIIVRDNSHYEIVDGVERCIDDEIPFEIPESWCWVRLGCISETSIGLTYSPSDISNSGTIVLRSGNIKNGILDLSDTVKINISIPKSKLCHKGDLLICARNGSKKLVGKCAIIDRDGYSFGAFMAILRSQFNPYIYYYLSSPLFRNDFDGINTTTINQITQDNLNNRLIPLPPLFEQQRIVSKIEELFSYLENLTK